MAAWTRQVAPVAASDSAPEWAKKAHFQASPGNNLVAFPARIIKRCLGFAVRDGSWALLCGEPRVFAGHHDRERVSWESH